MTRGAATYEQGRVRRGKGAGRVRMAWQGAPAHAAPGRRPTGDPAVPRGSELSVGPRVRAAAAPLDQLGPDHIHLVPAVHSRLLHEPGDVLHAECPAKDLPARPY